MTATPCCGIARSFPSAPEKHGPLSIFFAEVDGLAEGVCEREKNRGCGEPCRPEEARRSAATRTRRPGQGACAFRGWIVTAAVKPGDNVLALRVDHTKITDLSLGGILRPVMLIEKQP